MNMLEKMSIFSIGMLVGSSLIVAVKGHDLDQLYLENAKLRMTNSQLEEEVQNLDQEIKNKQKLISRRVRKIEITPEVDDEFKKLTITKFVKERTKPILDKELSYLDQHPQLIMGLIDDHVIKLSDQKMMTLHVTSLVIGETVRIWVKGEVQP